MKRDLRNILVIDLEATCWDGPVPDGQVNEIIEVGVGLLDIKTGELVANEGLLVRPTESEVSSFCTELTTITPEMVADAPELVDVCARLRKEFHSRERIFASWGNYDRSQVERETARKGIGYPFGPNHLNVKTLFALRHRLGHEVGMAQALAMLGLELEGTHHRGVDDAANIARILHTLL